MQNQFLVILVHLASLYSTLVLAVIRGPLTATDFPDPSIIQVGSVWYAFGSQSIYDNRSLKIQLATSTDLLSWTIRTGFDALKYVPSWGIDDGNTWAPDIIRLSNNSFLMYFSSTSAKDHGKHCVGTARSTSISGPYVPDEKVFDCSLSEGGSLDASGFLDDDGRRYVVWKIDANSLGHGGSCNNGVAPIVTTYIVAQQVSATDGATKIGRRVTILKSDPADGPTIEAPSLTKRDGKYVLFFSNNCYVSPKYATSYATLRGSSPLAMFTKAPVPLLAQRYTTLPGSGGLDATVPGNRALFHVLQSDGRRFLYSADLGYDPNGFGTGKLRVNV